MAAIEADPALYSFQKTAVPSAVPGDNDVLARANELAVAVRWSFLRFFLQLFHNFEEYLVQIRLKPQPTVLFDRAAYFSDRRFVKNSLISGILKLCFLLRKQPRFGCGV
jgi:hypothetical protein